jgi:hypothetical protein
MEEGIYEVDVKTLTVKELWGDEANKDSQRKAGLLGYPGKGFYSGQGVYVYANNGEHGPAARKNPEIPSGVLAEWDERRTHGPSPGVTSSQKSLDPAGSTETRIPLPIRSGPPAGILAH